MSAGVKVVTIAVVPRDGIEDRDIEIAVTNGRPSDVCDEIACLLIEDMPTVIDKLQTRVVELVNERNALRRERGER